VDLRRIVYSGLQPLQLLIIVTTPVDKRDTATIFRTHLGELIARSGQSRSRFAAKARLDRSTLTQLLTEANVRLPRAETIVRIAAAHGVSVDWLLGLSQQDHVAADVVSQMVIEPEAGDPADERLKRWHEEAHGFKIRYVPATLPDHLKTQAIIAYESRKLVDPIARSWSGIAHAWIDYSSRPDSDIEVCAPMHEVTGFARGEGPWRGLPPADRRDQLAHMADRLDDLYPAYRWFLFDGRERFSAPYTVFGPKRAVIYAGEIYLVFTSTELIREFTSHFDNLIRNAKVQPHECAAMVRSLISEVA
jgi:transcriptional regulator with XRE-family HTH domain